MRTIQKTLAGILLAGSATLFAADKETKENPYILSTLKSLVNDLEKNKNSSFNKDKIKNISLTSLTEDLLLEARSSDEVTAEIYSTEGLQVGRGYSLRKDSKTYAGFTKEAIKSLKEGYHLAVLETKNGVCATYLIHIKK